MDAPRQTRHSLDQYREPLEESLFDDLRLLSSELVTNAVQHSGRPAEDPIEITVLPGPRSLRVDVADGGAGVAPLRPRSQTPPSGLQYVDLLSDRWGALDADQFHVWFEIDLALDRPLHRRRREVAQLAADN